MLVLGLILILIAVGVLIAALVGGSSDPVNFDLGVGTFGTTATTVFLLGAATVLVFVTGLELTRLGIRRESRRRKEKKELHRLSERYGNEQDDGRDNQPSDRTRDSTRDPE